MDTQYYRYNRFCKITEENTGQRRTKRINDSQGTLWHIVWKQVELQYPKYQALFSTRIIVFTIQILTDTSNTSKLILLVGLDKLPLNLSTYLTTKSYELAARYVHVAKYQDHNVLSEIPENHNKQIHLFIFRINQCLHKGES
jgi:hypothetical protein